LKSSYHLYVSLCINTAVSIVQSVQVYALVCLHSGTKHQNGCILAAAAAAAANPCRSTPYISGVLALWKQSRQLQANPPAEGWAAAAKAALKNTAKPIPYKQPGVSTSLMLPPAFVGAGTVQAAAAITNCISITPTELLLQSGLAMQTVSFTVSNNCTNRSAEYAASHKPAFALDIVGDWSRKSYDPSNPGAVPLAAVSMSKNDVLLEAGQSQTVEVSS
jgi:hypothetical protein